MTHDEAMAIVGELGSIDETQILENGSECVFCSARAWYEPGFTPRVHKPTCLWLRARRLAEGETT